MTDEMTGLAAGRASGVQKALSISLNEREYLRGQAALVWGEEYVSPEPPGGERARAVLRIAWPDFGTRKHEEAA